MSNDVLRVEEMFFAFSNVIKQHIMAQTNSISKQL